MALALKPDWIIKSEDGSEAISPVILDDMAVAIRALQSIESGRPTGVYSHADTVQMMRTIAGDALVSIGGGFEPQRCCPVCDGPMAPTAKEGCVPGNCSYRGV